MNVANPQTFSRHRLRLVGRTDGGLHPAFYSSPNGDIVEHRICEITRDSGYPPLRNLANPPSVSCNPKEQTTVQNLTNRQTTKKPTRKIAHLVFSDTRANAQKTKRAIFLPTL